MYVVVNRTLSWKTSGVISGLGKGNENPPIKIMCIKITRLDFKSTELGYLVLEMRLFTVILFSPDTLQI